MAYVSEYNRRLFDLVRRIADARIDYFAGLPRAEDEYLPYLCFGEQVYIAIHQNPDHHEFLPEDIVTMTIGVVDWTWKHYGPAWADKTTTTLRRQFGPLLHRQQQRMADYWNEALEAMGLL